MMSGLLSSLSTIPQSRCNFGPISQQVHNLLFGGWKSKSLEWFNYKYPLLWYKLPKVCNITTGFSFLGYANHSVLQQFELNTGSIEVDRSVLPNKAEVA